MKTLSLILLTMIPTLAQDLLITSSEPLQAIVSAALSNTISTLSEKNVKPDELAVTLLDLSDSSTIRSASHRGNVRIYPASVIKLFYLEAAHRWLEDGKIHDSPELRRAMRDMIVDSSNDATHYVIDLVTGTTSGPELPPAEMTEWEQKRNVVNRYFRSQGYSEINVNQKPWCEGPYGRERIFVGEKYTNRNALTTDATARLLCAIALGKSVSHKRSSEMLELLKRDPSKDSSDPDDQARGFTAGGLPPNTKLWSKAGWTSETRHDAAYIELADGKKLALVIFTVNHANERAILPTLARQILTHLP